MYWKAVYSPLSDALADCSYQFPVWNWLSNTEHANYFVFLVCSRYYLRIPSENGAEGALQAVKPAPGVVSAIGTRARCSSNASERQEATEIRGLTNSHGQAAPLDA